MYQGNRVCTIIVAAGKGLRMGGEIPKQYMKIGGKSVLRRSTEAFVKNASVDAIYVVASEDQIEKAEAILLQISDAENKIKGVLAGGDSRQESVFVGLCKLRNAADIVLIHDAARPFVTEDVINRVINMANEDGAAISAVPVKDTIKTGKDGVFEETLPREILYSVQTPQGFKYETVMVAHEKAIEDGFTGTDDAVLLERMGIKVHIADGDYNNIKLTTQEDMSLGQVIARNQDAFPGSGQGSQQGGSHNMEGYRIGNGFDVHAFAEGHDLIIGGVKIPHEKGLLGHSDADVLIHALMDALLGAAALPDIGWHFPDSDEEFSGISSILLLERVKELLDEKRYLIQNIDVTVICERPKLSPYRDEIREKLADALGINLSQVGVKATTTEKLGFTGRGEGIAAQAAVLLKTVE